MPGLAFDAQAESCGSIDITENPGFVCAIAPAYTSEGADIFCQFLFEVESEAVFVSVTPRGGDVGWTAWPVERSLIAAHVSMVEKREATDCARGAAEAVPSLEF